MVGSFWRGGAYAVSAACTVFFIGQAFVPLPTYDHRIAAPTLHHPAAHGVVGLERSKQHGTNTFSLVPLMGFTALVICAQRSRTACRSLQSCKTLYFRRGLLVYPPRHQKNLRNRAYNIYMKNEYKKVIRKVTRYGYELQRGEINPGSLEEVMKEMKGLLDMGFRALDEACVQGVINRIEAAEEKDRVCKLLAESCMGRKYIERPEDPFIPAFKLIGYEIPECNLVREPRPWQLPGWKSPWMLKREYDRWQRKKREEQSAEA